MNSEKERFVETREQSAVGVALALLMVVGGAGRVQAEASLLTTSSQRQTMTTQSKFYCNINALNPNRAGAAQAID